jgi:hypothetical protein
LRAVVLVVMRVRQELVVLPEQVWAVQTSVVSVVLEQLVVLAVRHMLVVLLETIQERFSTVVLQQARFSQLLVLLATLQRVV